MDKLTIKKATQYIKQNYREPRHDISKLVKACKQTGKDHKINPVHIFFLLIENIPVPGINTHSYGFHTAAGRHLIDQTVYNYHKNN